MLEIANSDNELSKEEIEEVNRYLKTTQVENDELKRLDRYSLDEIIDKIDKDYLKEKEMVLISLMKSDKKLLKCETDIFKKCLFKIKR